MQHEKIRLLVVDEVGRWQALQRRQQRPTEFTGGAIDALTQMVVNIEEDPSPYWGDFDVEATQLFAISLIPNALVDMRRAFPRNHLMKGVVSSWEIWHSTSSLLDRWCPIPKNL